MRKYPNGPPAAARLRNSSVRVPKTTMTRNEEDVSYNTKQRNGLLDSYESQIGKPRLNTNKIDIEKLRSDRIAHREKLLPSGRISKIS